MSGTLWDDIDSGCVLGFVVLGLLAGAGERHREEVTEKAVWLKSSLALNVLTNNSWLQPGCESEDNNAGLIKGL